MNCSMFWVALLIAKHVAALLSADDEYDYTTSERGPTYEYEVKVRL